MATTGNRRPVSQLLGPVTPAIELSQAPLESSPRLKTGISEVDRVTGGGTGPGATVLIAGDPGIGKSTLMLQAAAALASRGGKVLYATGEESVEQVRARAARLGISGDGIYISSSGDAAEVAALIDTLHPALVFVDSIQTSSVAEADSAAGSVTQVRASTAFLSAHARQTRTALVLAGHVTKDGAVAGPKVLEHMVDAVLHMEGESSGVLRLLRVTKNRYGPTDEIGVFEMRADGLAEVADPSRSFLARRQSDVPGSAAATLIEGTRPITVEVQALVTPAGQTSPRRVANGVDMSRLLLIVAVMGKRLRLPVATSDIVVSVAGGLQVREPAADLPVALAIASSIIDKPIDPGLTAAGEIGLGGELRPVPQSARRVSEAARLGFRACLLPHQAADSSVSGAHTVPSLAVAVQVAITGAR